MPLLNQYFYLYGLRLVTNKGNSNIAEECGIDSDDPCDDEDDDFDFFCSDQSDSDKDVILPSTQDLLNLAETDETISFDSSTTTSEASEPVQSIGLA